MITNQKNFISKKYGDKAHIMFEIGPMKACLHDKKNIISTEHLTHGNQVQSKIMLAYRTEHPAKQTSASQIWFKLRKCEVAERKQANLE